MSAIAFLRLHTAADHDAVDAVFGTHDLQDAESYRRFLRSHARVLPGIEARLADAGLQVRARAPLIAADLADLGEGMPPPIDGVWPTGAAQLWGARYVLEGSRLGGVMLARGAGTGLPRRYLAAAHLSGEWRTLREATDAEAARHGPEWVADLLLGARRTFALYRAAA